ncbi:hypothetical protein [Agrobacterium tumefaciens]|uniref:hypothetical protein n=1 Tax=Agrobacterium tumefaciens TaxID=358 RepID=UPI0021D29347|nr:hypothetical protein [Agrobacterium tumefaciens]UXS01639.1 hypothetical protein FY156_09245 [Agrobacterium tumefaciens]
MLTTRDRKRRVASYIGAGIVNGIGSPANSVAPAITGTARVGQTLTSTTGTWSGSPTYARQWFAAGVAISGATGATYVPVVGDIGKVITVRVTASNDKGSVSVTSAATAAVVAA